MLLQPLTGHGAAGSPALPALGDCGFRRHGACVSLRGSAGEGAGREEDAEGVVVVVMKDDLDILIVTYR